MERRQFFGTGFAAAAGAFLISGRAFADEPETIYLHPVNGSDENSGAKGSPLRTLAAAARKVNASKGTQPITIILSEGVYAVNESALFKPENRAFTKTARLTVRAEVLPDDSGWSPGAMPVLIHTMGLVPNWIGRPDPFGGVSYGMQFETSHVTVQGLKILGTPYLENPAAKAIHRVYPIAREGAMLDDLEVNQCLFVGNREVAENHCGILARGSGVVVDHCVFNGCKITAVYWTGKATGCAMRNTLTHGNYVTGAWICAIADDFEFSNNVMSGNLSGVLFQGAVGKYNLASSLFAGNRTLYGAGLGPAVNYKVLEDSVLALPSSSKVIDKPVAIELDQLKPNYLHIAAGTAGSEIGAGLFTKKQNS